MKKQLFLFTLKLFFTSFARSVFLPNLIKWCTSSLFEKSTCDLDPVMPVLNFIYIRKTSLSISHICLQI